LRVKQLGPSLFVLALVLALASGCALMGVRPANVSTLVDLDPARADLAQSPLLEGADGLAFDGGGRLWATANERNALVTITPDGRVQEVAKNGSKGPLKFPSTIVIVGNRGYVSNFDTPRRDNMDADGKGALDGIGASISRVDL